MTKRFLIICLMLLPANLFAACHAVSVAGAGTKTGASWANAYQGIPSTITRGDRYYLADGNYTKFNSSTSGTTSVELRKAQSYDYGRIADGCSNDISTGWNAATMGASQAVFDTGRQFQLDSNGAWVINGNGQQTTPGCGGAVGSDPALAPANPKDCGIKISNTNCTGLSSPNSCSDLVSGAGTKAVTMKYVEILGNGQAVSENYLLRLDTTVNSVIQHNYIHRYGAVAAVVGGTSGLSWTDNYLWRNQVTVCSCGNDAHGQMLEAGDGDNGTVARNFCRDLGGTSIFMAWVGGAATVTSWKFYDNVVWNTAGYTPAYKSANGLLACINSHTCNSIVLSQNTVAGMPSGSAIGILSETAGSYTVQNNIWYGNIDQPTFGSGGSFTQDHNSFLNSGASCPSGTANVCNNAAANPFTASATGDFTIAVDGANVNNRTSLASPYNVDLAGTTFTSSRGAYQYAAGGPTTYTLSTATTGTGSGTITGCAGTVSSPYTYSCTVAPNSGSTLTSVSGCNGSGTTTYSGTMTGDCTVTATFASTSKINGPVTIGGSIVIH